MKVDSLYRVVNTPAKNCGQEGVFPEACPRLDRGSLIGYVLHALSVNTESGDKHFNVRALTVVNPKIHE